jgi:hypothetical protein
MTAIDNNHEFARNWDWYAIDPDGNIGHFKTAGLRPLPESVKQDLEGTEALDEHFQERALPIGSSLVRDGVEARSGRVTGIEAPPPSHTTGHTVFRIRRLNPAALPSRRKMRWHHKPVPQQRCIR